MKRSGISCWAWTIRWGYIDLKRFRKVLCITNSSSQSWSIVNSQVLNVWVNDWSHAHIWRKGSIECILNSRTINSETSGVYWKYFWSRSLILRCYIYRSWCSWGICSDFDSHYIRSTITRKRPRLLRTNSIIEKW